MVMEEIKVGDATIIAIPAGETAFLVKTTSRITGSSTEVTPLSGRAALLEKGVVPERVTIPKSPTALTPEEQEKLKEFFGKLGHGAESVVHKISEAIKKRKEAKLKEAVPVEEAEQV